MLPEDSFLVAIGLQFSWGSLTSEQAIAAVRDSQELGSLPDSELDALIDQADAYWRGDREVAVTQPRGLSIYPILMTTCVESRLRVVGILRKAAEGERKAELDARMAHWLGRLAWCFLSRARALLLVPDPPNAIGMFRQAAVTAAALPDQGRPRIREMIWALAGERFAASLGGWKEGAENAILALSNMVSSPERLRYFGECEADLAEVESVLAERSRVNPRIPEAPVEPSPSASPAEYGALYLRHLNEVAKRVLAGGLPLEEAKRELLSRIDSSRLEGTFVYLISREHRLKLARAVPEQAVVLAELNDAMARALTEPLAGLTRAYCAYALAIALIFAWEKDRRQSLLERAEPLLQEAFAAFSDGTSETAQVDAADVAIQIARVRGMARNVEGALAAWPIAIQMYEAFPPSERRTVNLGVAYGNMGSLYEEHEDFQAAFDAYSRALRLFLEAGDRLRVPQALKDLRRLAVRADRYDDAIAAAEEGLAFFERVGDPEGIARLGLDLAHQLVRVRRLEETLRVLERAEKVLASWNPGGQEDPAYLALLQDLLVWQGYVHSLSFKYAVATGGSARESLEAGREALEKARQIAVELQDDNMLAKALVQRALLFQEAGDFELAETDCQGVQMTRSDPAYQAQCDGILGEIRLQRGEPAAALPLLERAADVFSEALSERAVIVLLMLGKAHEALGDPAKAVQAYERAIAHFEESRLGMLEESRLQFASAGDEVHERLLLLLSDRQASTYDPTRALEWLERSRSRTFAEMLGWTDIPVPEAGSGKEAEQRLLSEIKGLRESLLFEGDSVDNRLLLQRELAGKMEALQAVWSAVRDRDPEYIALRTGQAIDWPGVRSLLGGAE